MKPLHLLVADDSDFSRLLIEQVVTGLGHTADFVEDGKQALDVFDKNHYDMLLMDIEMPVMTGSDATWHIRNYYPQPKCNVPILALTAHEKTDLLKRNQDFGFDNYLTKPFDDVTFIEAVNKTLEYNQNPILRLCNFTHLQQYCKNDTLFMSDIADNFVRKVPTLVSNLLAANEQQTLQEIQKTTNTLNNHLVFLGMTKTIKKTEQLIVFYTNNEFGEVKYLAQSIANDCNEVAAALPKHKF